MSGVDIAVFGFAHGDAVGERIKRESREQKVGERKKDEMRSVHFRFLSVQK